MKIVQKLFILLLTVSFIVSFFFVNEASAASFKDVKPSFWAYSSIEWAAGEGYINGYSDGEFKPQRNLTEAQFITILTRFDCHFRSPSTSGRHWADSSYAYFQKKNIPLKGMTNLSARDKAITRGEVARIIAAFDGLNLTVPYAVQYMYLENLSTGITGKKDYADYAPTRTLNRAEAVVFLERFAKRGNCELIGLKETSKGTDDHKYSPLPAGFMGDTTVWFDEPIKESEPVLPTTNDARVSETAIEKEVLVANGLDETFVTLMLKDCAGLPISYEEELHFQTTSSTGAKVTSAGDEYRENGGLNNVQAMRYWHTDHYDYTISGAVVLENAAHVLIEFDNGAHTTTVPVTSSSFYYSYYWIDDQFSTVRLTVLNDKRQAVAKSFVKVLGAGTWGVGGEEEYVGGMQASATTPSITTVSDGPEVTIAVKAPLSSKAITDTISFKLDATSNSQLNLACYTKPIEVTLDYVPKVELRVTAEATKIEANGAASTAVTAEIVLPGGRKLTNFNGRVRFSSAQNASLSATEVNFVNGVARTRVTSPNTLNMLADRIYAELIQMDSRYQTEVSELIGQASSTEIVYDPGIRLACSVEDLEVALIIDSSGSMKQNDPERLRVSKSQELLEKLRAPTNISADFNSSGRLLAGPADVPPVKSSLINVRESGGTNIGAGLEKALGVFSNEETPKVAILLTDGKSSKAKTRKVVEDYVKEGIQIYTVGLGDKKNIDEAFLQEISKETGGKYFHAQRNIDIGTAYESILTEVACGVPASCVQSSQVFVSPTVELTSSNIYMNTLMNDSCGEIIRVVTRFTAPDGDIDYDLIHRNHRYYELKKGRYEIEGLDYMGRGTFLAYNQQGRLVGQMDVPIVKR